jgi:hypothetical protein
LQPLSEKRSLKRYPSGGEVVEKAGVEKEFSTSAWKYL